jgi:hypothetical protein
MNTLAIRMTDARICTIGEVLDVRPVAGWVVVSHWRDGTETSEPVAAWGLVVEWVGREAVAEDECGLSIEGGDRGVAWFGSWQVLVLDPETGAMVPMSQRVGVIPLDWRVEPAPQVGGRGE